MNIPSSVSKIREGHLERKAYVYIRQSTVYQVRHHVAGAARQYDLKEHALTLGWTADKIQVVDSDLGVSGGSTFGRSGFKEMLSEIILGNVGAVFCLEVSRLTRDSNDCQYLIKACAIADTLIIDEAGIYDLSNDDDRLLLGIKGTLFEVERRLIKSRMYGARLLSAKKGELRLPLPVGFIYNYSGRVVIDPDEGIQQSIHLVFDLFEEYRSAAAVVRHINERELPFPKRDGGGHNGEVIWGKLSRSRLTSILHNPAYAGTFAFGRTRTHKRLVLCHRGVEG